MRHPSITFVIAPYVGVAVQWPGGNWTAQGTDHVTNATVFGQSVAMRGRGDRRVTGIFSFNVFKETGRNCDDNGPKRYTRAYRFEGGMRAERGQDAPKGLTGHCYTVVGHRKLARNASAFTGTVQPLEARGMDLWHVRVRRAGRDRRRCDALRRAAGG